MREATEEEYLTLSLTPRAALILEEGVQCFVLYHPTGFDFPFGKAFVYIKKPFKIVKYSRWFLYSGNSTIHLLPLDITEKLENGTISRPTISENARITGWV